MSDDYSDNDVQVDALLGGSALDPVAPSYGAARMRLSARSLGPQGLGSASLTDSSAISQDAAAIAEFAKSSEASGAKQEISWSSLQSLQLAVRSNTLPIDSVALAHTILRDENFPQGS